MFSHFKKIFGILDGLIQLFICIVLSVLL